MAGEVPLLFPPTPEPMGFSPLPSCSQTCRASAQLLCLLLASICAFKQPASPLGWVFSFVFTVGINQDLQHEGNLQRLLVYCLVWEMLLGWAHVSGPCCFLRGALRECCGKRRCPCLPWAGVSPGHGILWAWGRSLPPWVLYGWRREGSSWGASPVR